MDERERGRFQAGVERLLEPGETVRMALRAWGTRPIFVLLAPAAPALPIWFALVGLGVQDRLAAVALLWFLADGIAYAAFHFAGRLGILVVLTDRQLYVMKQSVFSSTRATGTLAKYPLGSVSVEATGSSAILLIGDRKFYVPGRRERTSQRAAALAASVSAARPAPATVANSSPRSKGPP